MSRWTKLRNKATGGAKKYVAFTSNLFTLGAASKLTGVGKWSGTEQASKWGTYAGYGAAAIATGAVAYTAIAAPAVAPVSAVSGLEIEAASGSGMGLWTEPAAVETMAAKGGTVLAGGAGSTVSSGGFWSSIGSGLKEVGAGIGIGVFTAALNKGQRSLDSLIDREVGGMFGGEAGSGSGGGGGGFAEGIASKTSMLPIIIIGVVILSASIFLRKRRA